MNNMGMHPTSASVTSSIRVLSFKPPSKTSSKLFHYIVPYIFLAKVYGAGESDHDASEVAIFLDTVGFTDDYPPSSPLLDERSHKAIYP